jgi:hypothetical protein
MIKKYTSNKYQIANSEDKKWIKKLFINATFIQLKNASFYQYIQEKNNPIQDCILYDISGIELSRVSVPWHYNLTEQ